MTQLERREVVRRMLAERPEDLLVVSGLGSPSWDVCAAGDDPRNFHFVGAMGQTLPFGLGLALSQPARRVLVISGDGDALMALGALATIANQAPANLAVLVLDNESYAETGAQPTATAGVTDLESVARGCGLPQTRTVTSAAELEPLRTLLLSAPGPVFAVAKIAVEDLPLVLPPALDGVTAINRFRDAILSASA